MQIKRLVAVLLQLGVLILTTEAADWDDFDHYDEHGLPIFHPTQAWTDLSHYDERGIPIFHGPQATNFELDRRQAVRSPSTYQQTITATSVGPDGFTTVPYATNGQQCSSVASNIYAVYDNYGVQYLYVCGGAITGDIVTSFVANSWSDCLTPCDLSVNCTGASYNNGDNYGVQNAAGQGMCTFKTQNGMYFTTTSAGQLITTRVAGMQRNRYMITYYPTTTTTTTTSTRTTSIASSITSTISTYATVTSTTTYGTVSYTTFVPTTTVISSQASSVTNTISGTTTGIATTRPTGTTVVTGSPIYTSGPAQTSTLPPQSTTLPAVTSVVTSTLKTTSSYPVTSTYSSVQDITVTTSTVIPTTQVSTMSGSLVTYTRFSTAYSTSILSQTSTYLTTNWITTTQSVYSSSTVVNTIQGTSTGIGTSRPTTTQIATGSPTYTTAPAMTSTLPASTLVLPARTTTVTSTGSTLTSSPVSATVVQTSQVTFFTSTVFSTVVSSTVSADFDDFQSAFQLSHKHHAGNIHGCWNRPPYDNADSHWIATLHDRSFPSDFNACPSDNNLAGIYQQHHKYFDNDIELPCDNHLLDYLRRHILSHVPDDNYSGGVNFRKSDHTDFDIHWR
ncbi:Hypothetical predicted protein [Lecanosticta acicola]|uniref:Uncharacterized protein n=1 Tax=Lecanosticta acicola TaxID=111012 RepID=A0AAI9E954_9PEZI|nr:Hypothetical predicted protein [Lecanosticta acicola]